MTKTVLTFTAAGAKSISDDDLCATCTACTYNPGELSLCDQGWPGTEDESGYVDECSRYKAIPVAAAAFLNPAQVEVIKVMDREGGHLGHLLHIDCQEAFDKELQEYGDTLVLFLIREMATSEGVESTVDAIRSVKTAMRDLGKVEEALLALPNSGVNHWSPAP